MAESVMAVVSLPAPILEVEIVNMSSLVSFSGSAE